MGLATWALNLTAVGRGSRIVVNGEDISERCSAIRVDSNRRDVPRLIIELIGEGTIEGEGIVELVGDTEDWREAAASFLDQLDPQEIDRAALAQADWNQQGGSALILGVITGILRGTDGT